MTDNKLVEHHIEQGIMVLELNHPPANTYSYEMMRALDDAILEARMNIQVEAIMLTGKGEKFFCAGADIAMLNRVTPEYKYNFCLHANETLLRLEQTPKLVVAAINGHCVGGGLEVALAADLRVAKVNGGKCGLPEVFLGVLPGTGGTQRLARILGKAKALEVMMRGDTFSFEEAKTLGLVHQVLPQENFLVSAIEYTRSFLSPERSSRAVGFIKRSVQSGLEMSLSEGLSLERELQQRLFEGEDAREGILAYNEKRKPKFKNTF